MNMNAPNLPATKSREEQRRLNALAANLAFLSRMVRNLAESNDRSEPVMVDCVKSAIPAAHKALSALVSEFGDGSAADTPRFNGNDLAVLAGDGALRIKKDEARKDEILIERSERGYKFRLPQAPCNAAISGMKVSALKISYHNVLGGGYRLCPAETLDAVIDFLRYWFEESPSGADRNRNGGKRLTVRVEDAK